MKLPLGALFAAVLFAFPLTSLAQDADVKAQTAPTSTESKKSAKNQQNKSAPAEANQEDKKEEEKKPGMNAGTFAGLKFRSIGPAVASGRVMSIAVNPKNKFE